MSTANNEEEQQKKNTDCVYFLASPLTCKKGDECEFRHSESARINPRDCWFWLSGNCLNTNCPFRHPPLEGRPAAPTATGGKPRVPCYYFAQGYCAKGDKCAFLHGLGPVATAETTVSHKISKPKALDLNDKQVSTSKGNGSVTSRPSVEVSQQMHMSTETDIPIGEASYMNTRANQGVRELGMDVNHVMSRVPEGSGSSAPSRPRSLQDVSESNRSKHTPQQVDDVLQPPVNDNFLQLPLGEEGTHEVQPEDDRLHDDQPEDETLQQAHSGERIPNGTESEELWEESSFDVLVDDGADQVIYAEEYDYLSSCDVLMDPVSGHIQGTMMGTDDLIDYEHAGAYEQYFDAAAEYELAAYDSYDQLGYDQLISYDYAGNQSAVAWKDREAKEMLLRDRREVKLDGEARRGVSSNDLRNHLVKRRRAERNQKLGEDHHRRRHQDMMANGFQHNHRHQDNLLQQQDVLGRRRIPSHSGARSNRQNYGHRDLLSRQTRGQTGSLGNKRPFRDASLDYDGASVERGSYKKMHNGGDHAKPKAKKQHGRQAPASADFARSRGNSTSNPKKPHTRKDESTFAGPKSLAQIKAEKMKAAGGEHSSHKDMQGEGSSYDVNHAPSHQLPISGSMIEGPRRDQIKAVSSKISDFDGPKPLSEILKEKRRGDADGEIREQIQERSFKSFSANAPKDLTKAGEGFNTRVSNAHLPVKNEKRDSDAFQREAVKQRHESDLQGEANLTLSLSFKGGDHNEVHAGKVKEVGHGTDVASNLEDGAGGDSVMDDVEYDDDEDDDFAKRLGGFFR